MATQERDVESRLTARVKERGGMCLKFLPDYVRGFPDRLVILPGGREVFVETKRPKGGRVSDVQHLRHGALRRMGCDVRVMCTPEEVDAFAREVDAHTSRE